MADVTGLAQSFVNTMAGRMRSETDYHIPKSYLGKVVSVRGADAPVVLVGRQRLKRTSYRIAKSVSVSNLKPGDEVLMMETYVGTMVMVALVRTDKDTGDRMGAVAKTSHSQLIGDGTATTFTITHGLGTKIVCVSIWNNSNNQLRINTSDVITATSNNAITITFTSAPSSKQYRVVVVK